MPCRLARRPGPRRVHTLLFWTVLLAFVAALGFVGLLAIGSAGHLIQGNATSGHGLAEFLVAFCVIVALAGATASRYHQR